MGELPLGPRGQEDSALPYFMHCGGKNPRIAACRRATSFIHVAWVVSSSVGIERDRI